MEKRDLCLFFEALSEELPQFLEGGKMGLYFKGKLILRFDLKDFFLLHRIDRQSLPYEYRDLVCEIESRYRCKPKTSSVNGSTGRYIDLPLKEVCNDFKIEIKCMVPDPDHASEKQKEMEGEAEEKVDIPDDPSFII